MEDLVALKTIGICETCFNEKLLIPRQSGLVPSSYGTIKMQPPFNRSECMRELSGFSHLILTWISETPGEKMVVKPPRLGGNKTVGVFASRSPFRPNPICSSIVELKNINHEGIHFSNHDLLDGTKLIDIKPYIPEWDSFDAATSGWVSCHPEQTWPVEFRAELKLPATLREILEQSLKLNPLPRYKTKAEDYGVLIADHEVKFSFSPSEGFFVHSARKLP
jgi:tRNA-Thr(GGU) m(6)t(6)A37 methyltransferase TsaA